ncbi:MAG TPA: ABC transporter substrate-binding protein [Acidimicrobiales bacterium]|nr:ABC transporter substrate-binding protein [Acidimicrobiales bacterium]
MRRKIAVLFVLFGLLAAACSSSSSPQAGGAAQRAATADTEAEVRIAAPEDQWPENGPGPKATHFAYVHNVNVYEPLVYLGSDYTLQPGLAERWELVNNDTTWRFHLRRGVQFHDGRPFSADDVVWTWGVRQMEGKTLPTVADTLGPDSVKKIDDFTVDFTPRTPNLRIPEQIVHPEGAIVPNGSHNDSEPPVGTGPFRVVSYTPKQTAVVERFEGYWGEKPKVKRMSIRFLPDPQTRLEALRSGQVDFVIDLPADATRTIEGDSRFRVVRSEPGRTHLIYINKREGRVTSERAVREAVALALDREAYTEVVFDGNAEPGRWMAPESVLGRAAGMVREVPFDPRRAARVLDEAGWRPGSDGIRTKGDQRLTLKLLGTHETPDQALVFIQSQLKAVGIDVAILRTPDVATRSALYQRGAGDFDLDLEPPNQNDGNPAFLPVLRMYSQVATNVQFAPNAPPVTPSGPEFDAQVRRALAATTTAEVQQASATMMRILSNEDYIVVPMAGIFRIYGMTRDVDLGDPHPSFTNQTWISLTKSTNES